MVPAVPTRAERVFLATLASEAERHEDVVEHVKAIIDQFNGKLTIEERNLFSIAYKNVTNTLRSSWRIIENMEKMPINPPASAKQHFLIRQQRLRIERELVDVCKSIVQIIDSKLIPAAKQGEESVFYCKMEGDYYRYLAEVCQSRDKVRFSELSLNAYILAYKHALATLDPLHPTRLGLALNFAVFYHDVWKSPERACHLAKSAFDDAVSSLDLTSQVIDQSLRDSLSILQLLRDDLILWSEELDDVGGGQQ